MENLKKSLKILYFVSFWRQGETSSNCGKWSKLPSWDSLPCRFPCIWQILFLENWASEEGLFANSKFWKPSHYQQTDTRKTNLESVL